MKDVKRLHPDEIRRHLNTRWMGRDLRCFDLVDSTNTLARELAKTGATHGTVVVAEAQRRGRGRLGRLWVSPAYKNIHLSVLLRPDLPVADMSHICLMAGVATCEALSAWFPTKIKWPNDVLIDGRKVAGILTEMDGSRNVTWVILGIGVNVNADLGDFPVELHDKVSSLQLATKAPVDRSHVTGRLLTCLERWYERLHGEGFSPIAAAWREYSDVIGQTIRVEEASGMVTGTVVDLDSDGALRLRLASGAEHRVLAGDVTVIGGYQSGTVDVRQEGEEEQVAGS